jgi:chromosome segregation ATPase
MEAPMPVEMLTYSALGERLNCSSEGARALAKRLRLPRQRANNGKALVAVDISELAHKPMPARSRAGDRPVTATLTARVEALQAELAKVEALAAGHREDFDRERERAESLMAELMRATADTLAAKEAAARLEGGLLLLRQETSDVRTDRDAWRSQVERLTLIEDRRNEHKRLRWWKRLAGTLPRPAYGRGRSRHAPESATVSL